MRVTISDGGGEVTARVSTMGSDAGASLEGKRIISLEVGDATIVLDGFDEGAGRRALELACALTGRALEILRPVVQPAPAVPAITDDDIPF